MRMLATGTALLLLVAACSGTDSWRAEAAGAIGDELARRLAEPLAQAADTPSDSDLERMMDALDQALDDMAMPDGVYRIVPGSGGGTFGVGYADVSLPLVVVPTDTEDMFCMIFALSSTGELVAEPAPGDPVDGCRDTNKARLTEP